MSESAVVPTNSDAEAFSGAVSPTTVVKTAQPPAQKEEGKRDDAKDLKEIRAKQWEQFRSTVQYYTESTVFTILMSVLTIWALYNSDIKFAATDKEADTPFEIIITIAFFLFIAEIIAQCIYKEDYLCLPQWKALEDEEWYETWYRRIQFGSFYFWLDWIATLSLILEVRHSLYAYPLLFFVCRFTCAFLSSSLHCFFLDELDAGFR